MIAPLPENEAERLNWLRQSQLLDTPAEDAFDDITCLVAQICHVPIAAVSLVDAERQWFKSAIGMPSRQTARDVAFCSHTILQSDVLVIDDATEDDRFRDNPSVTGSDHFRFYAGAPLLTSDGFALGSLCVIDRVPRQITDVQKEMLKVLALQVAGRIEMRRRILLQEQLVAQQQELLARQEQLVAERSQAQQAVLRSEQRLLFAVEGAGIGTWHWDIPNNIIVWSDMCKTLFGVPAKMEMSRALFYERIHPDDRPEAESIITASLQDGNAYDIEYRVVWPDGQVHWLAAKGRGYQDDRDRPVRFEGTVQNIDARKAAEADLREAAERQKTMLRDVLSSVTGGRLRLVESESDLPPVLDKASDTFHLTQENGLGALRQRVREAALTLGFADERWQDLVTAASEGGMNAINHGGGQGKACVSMDGVGQVQVRVQDWGTGINMENLPKATLARGWSSTASLGHGLVMMLQSIDRLWLLTGPSGTTVVMEQEREQPLPAWL